MARKPRIKTTSLPVPTTREQAEQLLHDIGRLQRQVATIETAMNDRLSDVKRTFEDQVKPLNQGIDEAFEGLRIYCEANRDQLCKGNSKTVTLATGKVFWRKTPPRVTVRGMDIVLETLKKLRLKRAIRTKEEVNKEAILLEPEKYTAIPGINITSREEFGVEPFESEIEKAVTVK
ncbi:host-nuclease inhibitor Gam family protein [Kistimonas scapharcae]|uniref:Host-nuclease inhibitor Gam family protein n=1 Tax=Kistimonas scapharcae TaxID=1036133 RepID=A0ABP8V6E2_9GAMM